jgi:hypothetical protein
MVIYSTYVQENERLYIYIYLGVTILSLFNTMFLLEFETVLTAWFFLFLFLFFFISFCFSYFIAAQKNHLFI